MAQAKPGDTVEVHYKGQLDDGTVFDSSEGRAPLRFTIGAGGIIPGFEQAVVGMQPGEKKTETIPAEQAYGPHREEMMLTVERTQLPGDIDVEVGQQLEIADDQGHTAVATIAEVNDTAILLDANHILAGQDLTFQIELVSIT